MDGGTIASRTVTIESVKLHYLTAGHGPAVILLYGYTQTSRMWKPIVPLLAEEFTVIAPDLPGIGDSAIPKDMKTAAIRIHALAKSLGIEKAIVVGHDIGLTVAYLVRAGKIHYAGLSNFPAWRIARVDLLAELRGWAPIAGIQIEYSLAQRTADRELLPMAEALGLGAALWSPLGGGFLTGKYRSSNEGRINTRLAVLVHTEKTERETAILDSVLAVAKDVGASPTEVAIAWLLHKATGSTTSMIPILGPRTREQLGGTLGAVNVKLSPKQIEHLDVVSAIPFGTPHEQIKGSAASIAGGTPELLEAPPIPVA